MKKEITVILNVYKRIENLSIQLNAIKSQSINLAKLWFGQIKVMLNFQKIIIQKLIYPLIIQLWSMG